MSKHKKRDVSGEDPWMVFRMRSSCIERDCNCCGWFYGAANKKSGQRVAAWQEYTARLLEIRAHQ